MDTQKLQQQIDELTKKVKQLEDSRWIMPVKLSQIEKKTLSNWLMVKEIVANNTIASTIGYGAVTGYSAISGTSSDYQIILSAGQELTSSNLGPDTSLNTQVYIDNVNTTGSTNSFMYGLRKPIYKNRSGSTVTTTSAGNTLTDSNKNWATNELADAMVSVSDSSGIHQYTRQIASNTATVITIDGTWPSTVTGGTYVVFMPMQFGASQYPWRQLYTGGTDVSSGGTGTVRRAIRIGYGTSGDGSSTAGTDTIGIFYGTSSPEGVVAANVGSLFLRTDGGATTTLYVKTSGIENTGWTAK